MTTEEIVKMLLGGGCTLAFSLLAWYAKDLVGNVKALTAALQTNATETSRLSEHVARLDKENSSLRRSHDALTRWLISRGLLPPPDPNII